MPADEAEDEARYRMFGNERTESIMTGVYIRNSYTAMGVSARWGDGRKRKWGGGRGGINPNSKQNGACGETLVKILIYKRYERARAREGVELEEAPGIQISGVTRGVNGGAREGGGREQGPKESEQPTTQAQPPTFI